MVMTTAPNSGAPILLPEQVDALLVQPAIDGSIAATVARVVRSGAHAFRIPIVNADPSAGWVTEGAEIPVTDQQLDEVVIVPSKLAALTVISRELADDSSPEAAETVGAGIARDLARKLDAAFFGNLSAPAPPGLGSLTTITELDAGAAWSNLDAFTAGAYAAEEVGAIVTSWITNPSDAAALATLKESSTSTRALLSADASEPGKRTIGGVPVFTSPAVPDGTVWGIPQDRVTLFIRTDAEIIADRSAYFTSDRVAIRGVVRAGFGFPHPAALVKITLSTP